MNKFKVGDEVRITKSDDDIAKNYPSGVFKIDKLDDEFACGTEGYWVAWSMLEPVVKRKKPVIVKIENINDIVGQDTVKKHLKVAVKDDKPVIVVGETGTGKTSIIRQLSREQKRKFMRFPITGETSIDDFVGKYTLKDGETVWQDGILLMALKNGWWLVVDEINMALPEILAVLQPLLDDDKMVVVAGHNGEEVKPHKDFRFFATMNPVDEYAGTKELNKALNSRFAMTIVMDYPEAETEIQILQQKCKIDEPTARKIVDFGQWARKAKKDDEIFYTCSTRDLLYWGDFSKSLPMDEAFEVTILNKAGTDRDKMAKFYSELDDSYKNVEKLGYTLSIDYFNSEVYNLNKKEKKLKKDREKFNADIDKTEKKIREQVIAGLVETVSA